MVFEKVPPEESPMAIQVTESKLHWNYFIALENDFEKVARYIEFAEPNFDTYAIELAHLILAVSSEVDVVAKALCALKDAHSTPRDMDDCRDILCLHCPTLKEEQVFISRFGITLEPWSNWKENKNPDWWKSYNKIKHQRNDHFQKANLKNALNSMAGLLVMVFYFYREKNTFDTELPLDSQEVMVSLRPAATLFRLQDHYYPFYAYSIAESTASSEAPKKHEKKAKK